MKQFTLQWLGSGLSSFVVIVSNGTVTINSKPSPLLGELSFGKVYIICRSCYITIYDLPVVLLQIPLKVYSELASLQV